MTGNARRELSRWVIYLAANQLLALGIILNTRTGLGVAAFSSVFYAMAKITGLTLGTCSMMLYVVLIVCQIALLKKVTLQIVCEIPFSLLFSLLTDLYDALIPELSLTMPEAYLLLAAALICSTLGVYFSVNCEIVVTPTDAIVRTISDVFPIKFALAKNGFDLSMIAISVILCLALSKPFYGVGPGTLISVLAMGRLIAVWAHLWQPKMDVFRRVPAPEAA
ncbi:MAG: YitT family protein [Atopobiaceae bacterium]